MTGENKRLLSHTHRSAHHLPTGPARLISEDPHRIAPSPARHATRVHRTPERKFKYCAQERHHAHHGSPCIRGRLLGSHSGSGGVPGTTSSSSSVSSLWSPPPPRAAAGGCASAGIAACGGMDEGCAPGGGCQAGPPGSWPPSCAGVAGTQNEPCDHPPAGCEPPLKPPAPPLGGCCHPPPPP